MKQKILTMLLLAGLTTSILAGCGQTENKDNAETQTTETAQSETTEETPEEMHTHNYTEAITTEPSCETDGLKTFTCECGDTYTEPISSTGHVYENYTFNNDATYSADGTETATCICGLSDTRTAQGTKLEYTYTDIQATMYAQQTVNVRDLPSTDGNKLGSLSTNDEVKVTGQADTGWYRIEYNGDVGYVSDSYLGNNKVEITQTTTSKPSGNWSDGYTTGIWYDMGEYFFRLVGPGEHDGQLCSEAYSEGSIKATLLGRYPDRKVIFAGAGPSNVAVITACPVDPATGNHVWSVKYIWN